MHERPSGWRSEAVRARSSPLARWRWLRGLTQNELAEQAGTDRRTLARLEQGAEPGVLTALRLARALEVRVEDVFTLGGSVPSALEEAEAQEEAARAQEVAVLKDDLDALDERFAALERRMTDI
ncbi:MAG: helix-turn-helix transcriptional regulator [Actinomycetota bacterium]|nr:helix-turn-helix transcriptional regulator [Actinomycetota bacterium]